MEDIIFWGAIAIVLIMSIGIVIRFDQHKNGNRVVDGSEVFLNSIKFCVYLVGAAMIYKVFNVNTIKTDMDVISCFAFLLCVIESVHTCINSIIEAIFGVIFKTTKIKKQ